MNTDVVDLTCALIDIASVSRDCNREIIDFCADWVTQAGMEMERLTYLDGQGVEKHNLVARAGTGNEGLGFFTHTDTVPGLEGWDPFRSQVLADRIVGRGSCDMKGPIAAALAAVAGFGVANLRQPLWLVFSADEEVGHQGASQIMARSTLLQEGRIRGGIVTEPTQMVPVYAHKGGAFMAVTAHGKAAHSSTELGDSAAFRIAPFMAEMAALKQEFLLNPLYRNDEFDPPTNGFNMTVTDFGCASNVTAERVQCILSVRNMPASGYDEAVGHIEARAAAYGLEMTKGEINYFYGARDSAWMQTLCRISGHERAITVPYGTEASVYAPAMELAVWGPGDIAQAHTAGEYIDLDQLHMGEAMYRQLIETVCS